MVGESDAKGEDGVFKKQRRERGHKDRAGKEPKGEGKRGRQRQLNKK